MNLFSFLKGKPAPAQKPDMPDYEQAILKTDASEWVVARHEIGGVKCIKCNHKTKGIVVLVAETAADIKTYRGTIHFAFSEGDFVHRCWTPHLNFTPAFCRVFAPRVLSMMQDQEARQKAAVEESTRATLRRALGL